MKSKKLDQSRLDVTQKTRSNIFNWRGQFTPQFVDYILESFAPRGGVVLDPFCGSGTVLLEAAPRQLPSIGCEINPAAYAMSKFVSLANESIACRIESMERVENAISQLSSTYRDLPLFEVNFEYRQKYKNLLEFAAELFVMFKNKRDVLLALIILIRAESSGRGDLFPVIHKAMKSVRIDLMELPVTDTSIQVELCDARAVHSITSANIDLILTSPPYINVFNYHQNYRALLEVLGFNLLEVAKSEIGSNRKNRSNRYRTVAQYCLVMEKCLSSFSLSL